MKLKEDAYPVDARGRPDLAFYSDPLEHYLLLYEQHLGALAGRKGPGHEIDLAFRRRVHATWGLIAKGPAAVPHALAMLKRREPEAREDGAAILAALGRQDGVVLALLSALDAEAESEPKDSVILALGHMRAKKAIPALARIIQDPSADRDTRWTAVEALGMIVRRRFSRQADPVASALAWLGKHGR